MSLNADVRLVDHRNTNCVQMAASCVNAHVFRFFYEQADRMKEQGFNWNSRNIDRRNIVNLVSESGFAASIRQIFKDLVRRDYIDPRAPSVVGRGKGTGKGASSANRHAAGPPQPGTSRHTRYAKRGPEPWMAKSGVGDASSNHSRAFATGLYYSFVGHYLRNCHQSLYYRGA